ncbi:MULTISPECIES: LuxR C-terminal-related transcriptional regulator [unclassified Bradyrhizobium]|uniref:LuxR C-terminal-related transcriptional regulator n=1 Tax=unclassified Bradyrhizobium TaxID=2631580 RepID=UPI00104FE19D|nr:MULTISPECIES: LuxR C-terminal-related transcriptional regulator [unclassified Bradyrhizobium]
MQLGDHDVSATELPESMLQYVLRTQEIVILDDASSHSSFSSDPYIVENYLRPLLCFPLINQLNLTGILYPENNLTPESSRRTASLCLNKQITNDIGIAESTVKVRRTNLTRKMKARSVPELTRMADLLNIGLQQQSS